MAAQQQSQPTDETLQILTRLSQKPGVQSTLIISRKDGAIVRTSGLLVSDTPVTTPTAADGDDPAATPKANGSSAAGVKKEAENKDITAATGGKGDGKLRSADEVARSVWAFFGAAGGIVDDMRGEGEDEVKLLRLRMKRCELIIMPDPNFLHIVIHDTPHA